MSSIVFSSFHGYQSSTIYNKYCSIKRQSKGQVVPRVVNDCINYIDSIGLETEGIFRRSVSVTTVRVVQTVFNEG